MSKKLKVPSIEETLGLIRTSEQLSEDEKNRRRHFNTKEREAIFILSGGLCEICGDASDLIGNQIINFPSLKVVKPLPKMALLCAAHVTIKRLLKWSRIY